MFLLVSPSQMSLFERQGLVQGAAGVLSDGGLLCLYGPFAFDGVLSPESNVEFDRWLREKDPSFGIRDVADLRTEAEKHGLEIVEAIPMPANNHMLLIQKTPGR
mmetsp:Transcript_24143/g.47130  ORF Transcript_24143/g.47130 Transcript_24143/m.47130 type:complete len:104 (+) Transcript_24143:138-449(+)